MLLTADKIIYEGYAYSGVGIRISDTGRIKGIGRLEDMGSPDHVLKGRVLAPGLVNAHSHAFQRLLRGRTQFSGAGEDNFWSWRQTMYWVANAMDPQSLYVTARHAFIEMLLSGVTTVGEFHYLHHQPDGAPYPNRFEMTDALVQAARDVGIRLSVIYALYYYGDFDTQASDLQLRFCDKSLDDSCDHFDALVQRFIDMADYRIAWAIAAHSLRAVSLEQVIGLKTRLTHMPFHMHVSEQRREVDACIRKYGMSPVELLASKKVLDSCTTLIHATHLREGEVQLLNDTGTVVCVCPSTEADLGDGLGHAAELFHEGVMLCLGTDGQTQSSIMAEARRMEMHERLRSETRNVFVKSENSFVATELFRAATQHGATALGVETGVLRQGKWADLVAYDLNDPSLAGADDHTLLSHVLFSSDSKAVRDVMVAGKWVVQDGIHPKARESSKAFTELSRSMFTPE